MEYYLSSNFQKCAKICNNINTSFCEIPFEYLILTDHIILFFNYIFKYLDDVLKCLRNRTHLQGPEEVLHHCEIFYGSNALAVTWFKGRFPRNIFLFLSSSESLC